MSVPTPPKRIVQHEIDAEAVKQIGRFFDRSWELRDLTGRDFGIDKIAEKFCNGIATGDLLLLQVKGTEKNIEVGKIQFPFPTKTLLYAELFSVPFLVLFCSLTNQNNCYYIWLQEYIKVKLNYDTPDWRVQESNTLYFPAVNDLSLQRSKTHLEYIAKFTKYKDCWVEYYNALESLNMLLEKICIEYSLFSTNNEYLDSSLQQDFSSIYKLLTNGIKYIKYIPDRFIPTCYGETIQQASQFMQDKMAPSRKELDEFLFNCKRIENSIVAIAQRFNYPYVRSIYEFDGSADY